MSPNVSDMVGKIFTKVYADDDCMVFVNAEERYTFTHVQDCCETVRIEEIWGDLEDLELWPLLVAVEVNGESPDYEGESCTWTFYKFATFKGFVDVRWLGASNGYYSESVDLHHEKL
jgi:hypothetical protein